MLQSARVIPLTVSELLTEKAIDNWFTPSHSKEKSTLKETSQEAKIDIKKVNVVIQWLVKKVRMKLFVYNVEHKPNYIYLLLHFFILKFPNNLVAFS